MTQAKKFFRKQFILRLNPEVTLDNALIKFLEASAEQGKKENAIIRDLFSAYLIVNASEGKMASLIGKMVDGSISEQPTKEESEVFELSANGASDEQVNFKKRPSTFSNNQHVNAHPTYKDEDESDDLVIDISQEVSTFESLGITDSFDID